MAQFGTDADGDVLVILDPDQWQPEEPDMIEMYGIKNESDRMAHLLYLLSGVSMEIAGTAIGDDVVLVGLRNALKDVSTFVNDWIEHTVEPMRVTAEYD